MNGAKPDEAAMWAALEAGETPRDAASRLGIHAARRDYICKKWATQGIYDFGTACDLGWIVARRSPTP